MPKSLDIVVNGVELKYTGDAVIKSNSSGGSEKFDIPPNSTVYETMPRKPYARFYETDRRNLAPVLADERFHRVPRNAAEMKFCTFYCDGGRWHTYFYANPVFYDGSGKKMDKIRKLK